LNEKDWACPDVPAINKKGTTKKLRIKTSFAINPRPAGRKNEPQYLLTNAPAAGMNSTGKPASI
jgi:hypothetical protein